MTKKKKKIKKHHKTEILFCYQIDRVSPCRFGQRKAMFPHAPHLQTSRFALHNWKRGIAEHERWRELQVPCHKLQAIHFTAH